MKIKEIYNRLAYEYDNDHFYPNSAANYVEERRFDLIRPYLRESKNLRILDVSCGTGTYLGIARDLGANAVGCDVSENMIAVCKNKGFDRVIINDYHSLPFKDSTFDLILCVNAIHYSDDPETVLNEMRRVLADNGTILFSYFNSLNFRSVNYIRKFFKTGHPISKEHRYKSYRIKKMFLNVRLIPTNFCGINLLPFPTNSRSRKEVLLCFFNKVELITRKTQLMHFFNEIFVVLKKNAPKQFFLTSNVFHEAFHVIHRSHVHYFHLHSYFHILFHHFRY
jgi:SAM-dependent methyltransferase